MGKVNKVSFPPEFKGVENANNYNKQFASVYVCHNTYLAYDSKVNYLLALERKM